MLYSVILVCDYLVCLSYFPNVHVIIYFSSVVSQERFYFGDNVLPCFESGIPLLKNRLQQLPDSDNVRYFLMVKTIS